MSSFRKQLKTYFIKYETYFKYFFSYFIIVVTLFSLFFFIFKKQLTKSYFEHRSQQTMLQLDSLSEHLEQDWIYLSQIDKSLKSNIKFIKESYETVAAYKYHAYEELTQYASTTRMIQSIVYLPKEYNQVFSTHHYVTYKDGVFQIDVPGYSVGDSFTFDPTPYYDATFGQLIFHPSKHTGYLLYFPPISSTASNIFFYILDTEYIQSQMRNCISEELPAIALVYENDVVAIGENTGLLESYITENLQLTDGVWQVDDSLYICIHTTSRDFSIVALLSSNFLGQQFINTLKSSWLVLMLTGLIGIVLIILSMRITYIPLRRLAWKVTLEKETQMDFLKLLDDSFRKVDEQNRQLKSKLNNYRISMQKSLLDSVFSNQSTMLNIDKLFDAEENNEIYVIHLASPGKTFPREEILHYFETMLSEKENCSVLDKKKDSAVYLLNYIGIENNKGAILKNLLYQFHEERGFLASISNGSTSPLDIPSLYENALHASQHWPEIPVADYQDLPPASHVKFTYPHEDLEQLTILLKKHQLSDAHIAIDKLLKTISYCVQTDKKLPDFYVRCILIDILSIVTNRLNQLHIDFKCYDELYYETLYFCRSCPYEEKSSDIISNIHTLLKLYEKESYNSLSASLIRATLEEGYADPNMSIALLADKFHVSIAYMSYLVRKEVDQNFSDYLWSLRLKKSKELLLSTQMSIEEISISVGYLNAASFRRKFKQETGLTPVQFRAEKQQ